MAYQATLKVLNEGGKVEARDGELEVTGADAVTLLLAAATDYAAEPAAKYKGGAPAPKITAALEAAAGMTYASASRCPCG